MRKLDRKLIRDLAKMKGQAAAIILVIAAGVATFVMSMCAYASLRHGQEYFYREFRFADVFSSVRRCPYPVLNRIREIPGIAQAESRLVYDVLLDLPELLEPATARLISIPDRVDLGLNHVYISRGRMLEPGRSGEVVVSELFAEAHQLNPNDTVQAIINGKLQTLTIVGLALSPEYTIQIQGGSLLPDKKRFAIFWISQRDLEAAFDMSGAFNSFTGKLTHAANVAGVKAQIDQLLEPYGTVGSYDRSQQLSHQYLTDELSQLRTMASMAPAIFLSVAAFLLHIVVSRVISQQREQIAALKAFGYTHTEVGIHYLNLVLTISALGTILGTLFGIWMAGNLIEMYQQFYRFPVLELRFSMEAIAGALVMTSLAAVMGTWLAVHRAMSLPPAEAMRPEPPPNFRASLVERVVPAVWIRPEFRMIIRNAQRKGIKSAMSVTGIAMAVAVLILGSFSLDALNYLIDFQFRKAQRQDLSVAFREPATASVIHEIGNLPGVLDSETIRSVASRIRFQHRERRVPIMGLGVEPRLFRLLNEQAQPVPIPEHGIMLNSKLADLLRVQLGDFVDVEILEGKRLRLRLEITAIVNEYGGINAYISKAHLHSVLIESPVASGAFLRVDSNRLDRVFAELKSRPGVANVTVQGAAIQSFQETVAENMLTMRSFNILFAVVIAVGVVYNSARISLSEQSRDLATMRVIGFNEREVSTVLLGEIGLFTVLAIPLGWLIGYALAAALVLGLDTENYRIPLVVSRSTFAMAAMVVILATLGSGFIVQRRIAQLDLVGVLKTRD